jgi:hypothetical protein
MFFAHMKVPERLPSEALCARRIGGGREYTPL